MDEEQKEQDETIQIVLPMVRTSKWDDIHQIFYQGQNYYRIVDFIDALEVSVDAADYWSNVMRPRPKGTGLVPHSKEWKR